MNCMHLKAEPFTGLTMDRKVLQWNWYLSGFLCYQDVVAKETMHSCTEEIAKLPIIPIPNLVTPPLKEAPIDVWGPTEWSHSPKA